MKRRQWLITCRALAGLAMLLSQPALAQPWPSRPISVVVVFAAGGTADIFNELIKSDIVRWRAVINDAKITAE